MLNKSIKAFTLIELLVVITIISILATTWVAVYTSQLQRTRDSARMTTIEQIKQWVEQFYQDDTNYPATWSWFGWVKIYIRNISKDPKSGQSTASTSLDYAYNVWQDENWIDYQVYEVSAWLENSWNIKSKANNNEDWGNDDYRLEMWIINSWSWAWDILNTSITWDQKLTSWIKKTPDDNTCVTNNWTTDTAWESCWWQNGNPMVIR